MNVRSPYLRLPSSGAPASPPDTRCTRAVIVRGVLAQMAALVLLGVASTFDAWVDIFTIAWRDPESSQVLLAPLVIAWLVWVRRQRIRQTSRRGMWLGPVIILAGWGVHVLGDLNLMQSLWHGGAVLVLVGCIVSALGANIIIRFLPAFLALAFLVPVPGIIRHQVSLPLQNITTVATGSLLELFGVTVAYEGNLLNINGVDVGIAEACNGLRMVWALVLTMYAFAFGVALRWHTRLLLILCTPLAAIASNVLRLTPTLLLYGYAPQPVADAAHDAGGWAMIMMALALLFGLLRLMRWALIPVSPNTLAYQT
ncbi:MAG: hypothetical protein GVY24_07815 [Planctomycetes bacterium]|jgi:exosortase|nr:hypothetical protein [Planctomycetota bacterium]